MKNRKASRSHVAIRPGARIECRIGGADLNPYLAKAALLAACMDGIRQQLPLPDEFRGNAYDDGVSRIPKTLRAATRAFAESAMLRAAFGDNVIDHYVHAAKWEIAEHDRVVTDWEVRRGFERS